MSVKKRIRKNISVWFESLVITALFIAVSKLLHDPLSLNSAYPWIWFAPVFVALHYGLLPSQFSIILLLCEYLYLDPSRIYDIHLQLFILGGFILTIICATWQNSWLNKIAYSNGISTYLQKRIEAIAYTYKLTSLAYQRLENNYISKPVTVRTSMSELREMLANVNGNSQEAILTRFLNILANTCSLERAAIFPVIKNKVIQEPIASIGIAKTPPQNNFFINECMENGKITFISADEILKGHLSDYLVGAPFINQKNEIYALLLVEEMPFLSLNDENMATMNLLLEYFLEGNLVKNAELIVHQFPGCPVVFANELQRLFDLVKSAKKNSALQSFIILDKTREEDYLFRLKQEIRGLDNWWETSHNGTRILMILMPFTDRAGSESYRMRINTTLFQEFGVHLNQDEIKFRSYQLSSFKTPASLIEAIVTIK